MPTCLGVAHMAPAAQPHAPVSALLRLWQALDWWWQALYGDAPADQQPPKPDTSGSHINDDGDVRSACAATPPLPRSCGAARCLAHVWHVLIAVLTGGLRTVRFVVCTREQSGLDVEPSLGRRQVPNFVVEPLANVNARRKLRVADWVRARM